MLFQFKLALIALPVICSSACVDVSAVPLKQVEPDDLLSYVKASTPALVMYTGESIKLSLTAYAMAGNPLFIDDPGQVYWKSLDPEQVSIDSVGLVTAHLPSTSVVNIIGLWSHKAVTKADTISVYVTSDYDSFDSIRIVSLDSTVSGAGFFYFSLPPRVRIDLLSGDSVVRKGSPLPLTITAPGMSVDFLGDVDGTGDLVFGIYNRRSYTGPFFIHAIGTVYGLPVSDSVKWSGVYPALDHVNIESVDGFDEIVIAEGKSEVVLQPCGTIVFSNISSTPIDIVFDDSTSISHCDEDGFPLPPTTQGNIYGLASGGSAGKKFSSAGRRDWRIRHAGTKKEYLQASGSFITKHPDF